jgi:hypothetical protein
LALLVLRCVSRKKVFVALGRGMESVPKQVLVWIGTDGHGRLIEAGIANVGKTVGARVGHDLMHK